MSNSKNVCPVDSQMCTGCGLCHDICPVQAIKMQPDTILGHLRPAVDREKCISCRLCERKCPSVNPVNKQEISETYAAWAKDDNKHFSSSSGGIASSIYEYFISTGGLIVGVQMKGISMPQFECASSTEKIEEFKKSKYLQVNHARIYKKVLDELKTGRTVAFVGLPCHCAAMKRMAEGYDDSLVLIDLICHGTPSFEVFSDYLGARFSGKNITGVKFRDPKRGEVLAINEGGKEIYKRGYREDPFLYAFMYGDLFADSCYNCLYAGDTRVSDMTIGDFWGLGKKIPFDRKVSRISCVLINTPKGKKLFENLSSFLEFEERPTEEAVEGNSQLQHAASVGVHRDQMIAYYKQGNAGNGLIIMYGDSTEKTYKKRVCSETIKGIGKALGLKKLKDLIKR